MGMRRSPWFKALRSRQVIAAILALIGAVVAVLVVRPAPIEPEPFELPELDPVELETQEFRVITYDRFNLEVPLRLELEVPADEAGRTRALLAALREQFSDDLEAWPESLDPPAVFILPAADGRAVLDFTTAEDGFSGTDGARRLARSISATLEEAGFSRVNVLFAGEAPGAEPGSAAEEENGSDRE